MPHPVWTHYCAVAQEDVLLPREVCSECGRTGERDGWGYSMIERMGAYSRCTGLKPMGPHRRLTDMLLSPMLMACPDCEGRGLVDVGVSRPEHCWACLGGMHVRGVSNEEFAATRRRILREFPDADSADWWVHPVE